MRSNWESDTILCFHHNNELNYTLNPQAHAAVLIRKTEKLNTMSTIYVNNHNN